MEMQQRRGVTMRVTDINGRTGTVAGEESSTTGERLVVIQLEDGGEARVRPELLLPVGDHEFRIDQSFDDPYATATTASAASFGAEGSATVDASRIVEERPIVVPVVEEQFRVRKRVIEKSRVRVSTSIDERVQVVETPLMSEHVTVERVEINKVVDEAPEVRSEGDVTIIPVFEEVLVVEKRLLLREEIHLHWDRTEEVHREEAPLRRETVHIERLEADRPENGRTDGARRA
jgi:uncharacterized protein (TIGR02271 family)